MNVCSLELGACVPFVCDDAVDTAVASRSPGQATWWIFPGSLVSYCLVRSWIQARPVAVLAGEQQVEDHVSFPYLTRYYHVLVPGLLMDDTVP